MRHSLTLTTIIFSLVATAPGLQAQQAWTLDRCISYALDHHIQVQQAQQAIESAEADVKQARAALFPSLTFSSSQSLSYQNIETQNYATFDSKITNPTYNGSYGLGANVTLYNGGANWNALRQSRINLEADQLAAQKTAAQIELQIIQAYYQILYAHESVAVDEAIVNVARQELERSQAKLEVGKGTKVDVAQMEGQYQQSVYQLVNARNQEASSILTLKKLLQLDPASDFTIDYRNFSTDDVLALIPPLADVEQMALNHQPDLRVAELHTRSAELQTRIAKGGYLPTVGISAGVSTGNGNTYKGGFISQIDNHMRENVAISVNVPILDNRRTRTTVDKAKIQYANALLSQEDARLQLQNTIATLHLDIQSAQSRYQSALAKEASSRESFELMDERYTLGLESVIDLLTSKNEYLQASQEVLQSKYTALMNLSILHFYIGQ